MRKSRLFSLLCAFWPGAGEMYLGLMRRGLAIMTIFWGVIVLSAGLGISFLIFVLPIVWFYSFFDTLTLRNLDYYALVELQEKDEFFFQDLLGGEKNLPNLADKYHTVFGAVFILVGLLMLYTRLNRFLYRLDIIPSWMHTLLRELPVAAVAFGIIALGLWLIRGKRMPADTVEDYPHYKEGDRDEKEKDHDKRSA